MDALGGQDNLDHQPLSSTLYDPASYFANNSMGHGTPSQTGTLPWDVHSVQMTHGVHSPSHSHSHSLGSSDPFTGMATSADNSTGERISGNRVLTRRQKAALGNGRSMDATIPQLFSTTEQLQFHPSFYNLQPHLNSLAHGSRSVSPTTHMSVNPAEISPPARRDHTRHTSISSVFESDPVNFSPSSNYSRNSRAFARASSPASSVASSSFSAISGSLSLHSQSTCSSTNDSSLSQTAETDDVSSSASPDGNKSSKEKHTKNKLRNMDRKEMCLYAEQNPKARQEDIASRFGVERSTVSKVLKNKAHWLSLEDEEILKIAKHRPIKFPDIESDVLHWVHERAAKGELVTDAALRERAKDAARRLGVGDDDFKASGGWIENFKQRNRIKRGKVYPARSERPLSRYGDSEDHFSVASSMDEIKPIEAVSAVTSQFSVQPLAIPETATIGVNDHGYATRSKRINAYQLQESVTMMSSFIREVFPEGFTDEQRRVWAEMEQRTREWAFDQMRIQGSGF